MDTSFNPNAPAKQYYGPGILNLPLSVLFAKTAGEQVDALYELADSPNTPPHQVARYLRMVQKHYSIS